MKKQLEILKKILSLLLEGNHLGLLVMHSVRRRKSQILAGNMRLLQVYARCVRIAQPGVQFSHQMIAEMRRRKSLASVVVMFAIETFRAMG